MANEVNAKSDGVSRQGRLAILACLSLLVACTSESNNDQTQAVSDPPVETPVMAGETLDVPAMQDQTQRLMEQIVGSWKLVALDGEDVPQLDAELFIDFGKDNTVSGFSGVNRFSGAVTFETTSPGKLALGPLAGTRMAGPPQAMEWEQVMMERLGAVRTFDIRDDTLYLYAGDNEALRFTRREAPVE